MTVRHILKPFYRASLFNLALFNNNIKKKDLLILATITKTGTHFIRYLLGNYLNLRYCQDARPLENQDVDKMFPNGWHTTYLNRKKIITPSKLLPEIGLYDIPRSHIPFEMNSWKDCKVLHTYRNPFDFGLSLYVFKYCYQSDFKGNFESPYQVLEHHLDDFINQYKTFLEISKSPRYNILRISFEELYRNSEETLDLILKWLGCEPRINIISDAVKYTRTNKYIENGAGELWQRKRVKGEPYNKKIVNEFMGKCNNSGPIGIWKDYFTNEQKSTILNKLEVRGIREKGFIFE
jgi:hypothetical protein